MGDMAKQQIQARLRRIEGQVRGLQRMVDEEAGCAAIMDQVAAVRAAISQVGVVIFQNHVRQCLKDIMTNDDPVAAEEAFTDIIRTMGKIVK